MPRPTITARAMSRRPVTSSAWSPSTRPDERSARDVRVGGGCLREVDFREVVLRDVPVRELPDRPVERLVQRPLPDEREEPLARERDPWRVVTVATNLPVTTPATSASASRRGSSGAVRSTVDDEVTLGDETGRAGSLGVPRTTGRARWGEVDSSGRGGKRRHDGRARGDPAEADGSRTTTRPPIGTRRTPAGTRHTAAGR